MGAPLDRFGFFFAFYGLILGLAVTELLGGFGGIISDRETKKIEPQIGLLGLLTFVVICATWIDAWKTERNVTLDFAGLWAPILIGTTYYLAAYVVFPRNPADYDRLAAYYAERKRFVLSMLIIAGLLIDFTYRKAYINSYEHEPAVFWLWNLPSEVAIFGSYIGIWFARSVRANIAFLTISVLVFVVFYWQYGFIRDTISRSFGY